MTRLQKERRATTLFFMAQLEFFSQCDHFGESSTPSPLDFIQLENVSYFNDLFSCSKSSSSWPTLFPSFAMSAEVLFSPTLPFYLHCLSPCLLKMKNSIFLSLFLTFFLISSPLTFSASGPHGSMGKGGQPRRKLYKSQ